MKHLPNYDRLYEIAEGQAGYFASWQARDAGFSWERLSSNTKSRKFIRISHGIYRLVYFPSSPYEDLFVVWLRTGPASVISHESALAIYNLSDVLPKEVHVIIPRTASRRRKGIRLHTHRLAPDEVTVREGLPVTTVARTISDVIVSGLAYEHIYQAVSESLARGLSNREDFLVQGKRRGGRVNQMLQNILKGERSF